ncbi:MAG: type II toxin-antitoxin system VapC family toxin [Betaproteobacteria bacterium]|nr:type II toxin-antitoxin system VapC family toxin [Betaproteobacteria bacterium]
MIAVDTNVLVRLLTGDDPEQTQRAVALFSEEHILIPKTVLLETEWVLRYSYGQPSVVILAAFHKLIGLPQVTLEDGPSVMEALQRFESGMDFADALHLASGRETEAFVTFDARLKKRAGREARVRLL